MTPTTALRSYNGGMRRRLTDGEVMGLGIGTILAIAVGGLLGTVRGEVDQANVALALAGVVALAAGTGGRIPGAGTGLVAAASFDVFHTRPYGSLAIKGHDDVLTTVGLVLLGLVIGQLASSRQEGWALQRRAQAEVDGLYRVAGLTAEGAPLRTVVAAVEAEVAGTLGLVECRFRSGADPSVLVELAPDGRVEAPYRFEGDGFLLPDEGVVLAVRQGDEVLGWLEGRPGDRRGVSRDRRRVALVLADHLALRLAADPRIAP